MPPAPAGATDATARLRRGYEFSSPSSDELSDPLCQTNAKRRKIAKNPTLVGNSVGPNRLHAALVAARAGGSARSCRVVMRRSSRPFWLGGGTVESAEPREQEEGESAPWMGPSPDADVGGLGPLPLQRGGDGVRAKGPGRRDRTSMELWSPILSRATPGVADEAGLQGQ